MFSASSGSFLRSIQNVLPPRVPQLKRGREKKRGGTPAPLEEVLDQFEGTVGDNQVGPNCSPPVRITFDFIIVFLVVLERRARSRLWRPQLRFDFIKLDHNAVQNWL